MKNETNEWSDFRFGLNAWRSLSSRLQFNLSDTFIMTNDLWDRKLSSSATGIPEDQPDEEDGETIVAATSINNGAKPPPFTHRLRTIQRRFRLIIKQSRDVCC